jgi:hypothetical protein
MTGQGIEPVPISQVAFRWTDSVTWVFIPEAGLDKDDNLRPYVSAKPGTVEIRVLGPTQADMKRLMEKLETLGINFIQRGMLQAPVAQDGQVQMEIASQLDATIFRAIAKIAFNYVAHQHGARFALQSDFDEVRNFIRYGTTPSSGLAVQHSSRPILTTDTRNSRQTNGHLITFDWNAGGTGLLAQVSLFNAVTYRVVICPHYSGLWHRDMRRGHHFDIEDRSITPLFSASLGLLP